MSRLLKTLTVLLLFFTVVFARSFRTLSRRSTSNQRSDETGATPVHCHDDEPCQFGTYRVKEKYLYSYHLIPSWCSCPRGKHCILSKWDERKKADTYTCRNTSVTININQTTT